MSETLLTTTSTAGLQPLGAAAQRSYELVSGTVRERLGQRQAMLFAEPVASAHGETVDWYTQAVGKPVAMEALEEGEAQAFRDQLGLDIADISSLASDLAESRNPEDWRLAEALQNAIEVPDEAMIFAMRGEEGGLQPVLVHWAWLRDERSAVRGVLTAMVPRAVPLSVAAEQAAATAAASRPPWAGWWWLILLILLGWLLLALMLAAILYLLIAPCGLTQGRIYFCPEEAEGLTAVETEHRVVQDRIARLQHELALSDRACQPTIPVKAVPAPKPDAKPPAPEQQEAPDTPEQKSDVTPESDPVKSDPARDDVTRRMTERGGQQGDLNFTLSWTTTDDIDLLVTCPGGQTLSYKNRADCGGVFDLDANVDRATAVSDPVENIRFEDVTPGLYKVAARLKGNRNAGDKIVTLHVLRRDGRSQSYSGRVGDGQPEWTINLSISG